MTLRMDNFNKFVSVLLMGLYFTSISTYIIWYSYYIQGLPHERLLYNIFAIITILSVFISLVHAVHLFFYFLCTKQKNEYGILLDDEKSSIN
jgi:hypothetical protein